MRAANKSMSAVCGGVHSKWVGQCPDCESWNCLEEATSLSKSKNIGFLGKTSNTRSFRGIDKNR